MSKKLECTLILTKGSKDDILVPGQEVFLNQMNDQNMGACITVSYMKKVQEVVLGYLSSSSKTGITDVHGAEIYKLIEEGKILKGGKIKEEAFRQVSQKGTNEKIATRCYIVEIETIEDDLPKVVSEEITENDIFDIIEEKVKEGKSKDILIDIYSRLKNLKGLSYNTIFRIFDSMRKLSAEDEKLMRQAPPNYVDDFGFLAKSLTKIATLKYGAGMTSHQGFWGPKGLGKSLMADVSSYIRQSPMIKFIGNSEVDIYSLMGSYVMKPGLETIFEDGPVIRAMRENKELLIDEVDMINPAVLSVLNMTMQEVNPGYGIPQTGEWVSPKDGFRVVVTGNVNYEGSVAMNKSFLDRLSNYCIDFNDMSEEQLDISKRLKDLVPKSPYSAVAECASLNYQFIEAFKNDELPEDCAMSIRGLTRALITFSEGESTLKEEILTEIVDKLEDRDQRKIARAIVDMHITM